MSDNRANRNTGIHSEPICYPCPVNLRRAFGQIKKVKCANVMSPWCLGLKVGLVLISSCPIILFFTHGILIFSFYQALMIVLCPSKTMNLTILFPLCQIWKYLQIWNNVFYFSYMFLQLRSQGPVVKDSRIIGSRCL